MENTEVEIISQIETTLAKENITTQVIAKLKTDYLGLKINGLDDKIGFKAVEDARKHCKELRVLAVKICKAGREEAITIQKQWIEKEKEVVAGIDVTESYLENESNKIKEEEKRILFEAAQKAKLPFRVEKLNTIGVSVEDAELLKINDEQFASLFNDLHSQVLAKQAEEIRIEKQRIADVAAAEQKRKDDLEREKQRLENERLKKERESQDEIIRVERAKAKIESDKQAKILADQKRIADQAAADAKAIADAKLKTEREAKEKAEAELKAKQDAEQKIKSDKAKQDLIDEENRQKALLAPDKEKLTSWVDNIMIGLTPQVGAKAHKKALDIHVKFSAFQKWAKEQIELL